MNESSATPLMQQYFCIKKKYPHAFLFFQVGDFYELFFEDAKKASQLLSITLTKRGTFNNQDIPLCGVPVSNSESYTLKLVSFGYTVVICSQTEIATPGKLVNREVTSVVSPSTITSDSHDNNNSKVYTALVAERNNTYELAFFEYITQSLMYVECKNEKELVDEIMMRNTQEIICDKKKYLDIKKNISCISCIHSYEIEKESNCFNEWIRSNNNNLLKKCISLSSLLFSHCSLYYNDILKKKLHISEVEKNKFLLLDHTTQKHLELIENQFDKSSQKTLFSTLNYCSTSMGARFLKQSLIQPLKDYNTIVARQQKIQFLKHNYTVLEHIKNNLEEIGDLERIAGRINLHKTTYRDYQKLTLIKNAYSSIKKIVHDNNIFEDIRKSLLLTEDFFEILEKAIITQEPNPHYLIHHTFDQELYNLYIVSNNQSKVLIQFEVEENKKYNRNDIKIRHTPMYGYVFEITKVKGDVIPSEYKRVQTLSNRERYISDSLKSLENTIIEAEQLYREKEKQLFNEIQNYIISHQQQLMYSAQSLCELDMISSLAQCAFKNQWNMPIIEKNSELISIINGKHPIISPTLAHSFVPNSLEMNEKSKSWIITGPNMGGKSTFMKQNALIIILAQIGSAVPVESAIIPIFESIFTRMGATDYLSEGKSTFYVEMEEAKSICLHASPKSFVILDEIGRGTSTYDGMALAASIVEYLSQEKNPYLLFATHYHEIDTILDEKKFEWYFAKTQRKSNNEITLLYTIKKGKSEGSMGIEIAHHVGLPEKILKKASVFKDMLENQSNKNIKNNISIMPAQKDKQSDEITNRIKNINLDDLSPRQAYTIIEELKEIIKSI